jgi:hypothetical protein
VCAWQGFGGYMHLVKIVKKVPRHRFGFERSYKCGGHVLVGRLSHANCRVYSCTSDLYPCLMVSYGGIRTTVYVWIL